MTVGIMQPYFFPYIGYFQYITACDRFVLYDDVQFIMRGWINRNYILYQGRRHLITVPLAKASPNKLISETMIAPEPKWAGKTLRTLEQAYRYAPYFPETFKLIQTVIEKPCNRISDLAGTSIIAVADSLGIDVSIVPSSKKYSNAQLDRAERIIDICWQENASRCIVPVGGSHMYDRNHFRRAGIILDYISPVIKPYRQFQEDSFEPSLSIIDVLMFNGFEETASMAKEHELL